MTLLRLTRFIKDALSVSLPATPEVFTIVSAGPNQIQVTPAIAAADGAWRGGLLRITSGGLIREAIPVIDNIGSVVYLADPVTAYDLTLLSGATCQLEAGPLGAATVFYIQQDSVSDLVTHGVTNFVYISPVEYTTDFRGVARNDSPKSATKNKIRAFDLSIVCAVPFKRGGATLDAAFAGQTAIYDMAEQVMALLHQVRGDKRIAISDTEPIQCQFGLHQKEGEPAKAEVAVISANFDLNT